MNDSDLLVEGEAKLHDYQVSLARWTTSGWVPTVPPLHAMVTSHRLILLPQQRRRFEPASIPHTFITRVQNVLLGEREGVAVEIKTGLKLFFLIGGPVGARFSADLRQMVAAPTRGHYKPVLPQQDLKRLIAVIRRL